MNDFSTAAGIGDHIGALEWGDHLESHGDDVLETAAHTSVSPNTNPRQYLTCMADGALEAAGVTANGGPTTTGYCPPTRVCR